MIRLNGITEADADATAMDAKYVYSLASVSYPPATSFHPGFITCSAVYLYSHAVGAPEPDTDTTATGDEIAIVRDWHMAGAIRLSKVFL